MPHAWLLCLGSGTTKSAGVDIHMKRKGWLPMSKEQRCKTSGGECSAKSCSLTLDEKVCSGRSEGIMENVEINCVMVTVTEQDRKHGDFRN